MTISRDPDVLIREFLEQGVNELPDRSYDMVRSTIDSTRQRVVLGPWREGQMTRFAMVGLAATAIVLLVVVGFRLLPGSGNAVGAPPTITPSTPVPTLSPTPSAGTNLPDELLGSYLDGGEQAVVWEFLAAGDPYCTDTAAVETSCFHIWRTNIGTTADYGGIVMADPDTFVVTVGYDDSGLCMTEPVTFSFVVLPSTGNLRLSTAGTCWAGYPRGDLLHLDVRPTVRP